MMSTSKTQSRVRNCPACGAHVDPAWAKCWLCGERLGAGGSAVAEPILSKPARSAPVSSFSMASMMMLVTLVAVVLGVCSIAPGIGVPLGIVMLIVWLRTTAVVKVRQSRGKATTLSEKAQLFAQSFAVLIGLIILTQVALVAAAFGACFVICTTMNTGGPDSIEWLVLIGASLAALAFTIWLWVSVVRSRWRRDAGDD
jgi:hypothetical protein